jgi:hypothetical protein
MCRLTTGICFEKFLAVRTSHTVITQTHTVQYSLLRTYALLYSLLLLGYKPVQNVTVMNLFIISGSAAQHGLCTPHPRGFLITHNCAPQSVGLLRTSDQSVAETST